MKRILCLALIFLVGFLVVACRVDIARSSGSIFIRANGTVDGTNNIVSSDKVTYSFIDDIFDNAIVVERDNIVIDGTGHTLQGRDESQFYGITLTNRDNITIQNLTMTIFDTCILVNYSTNVRILGNALLGNCTWSNDGVSIWQSSNVSVIGNYISQNSYHGVSIGDFSSHNSIVGNNISENYRYGIRCWGTYNNISSNYFGRNLYEAIYFSISSNNVVSDNAIIGTYGSTPYGNGIFFYYGSNSTLTFNNNITECPIAVGLFYASSNNTIFENSITQNENGVRLFQASGNKIYHNNFSSNALQVNTESSANTWDNGYPLPEGGGNYWGDFKTRYPSANDTNSGPYQNTTGSDEIWDDPYIIDENNKDNYPIVPEFPPTLITITFMASTLLAIAVSRKKHKTGTLKGDCSGQVPKSSFKSGS